MKSKSLILLVISMGFGLVAAIGISQVMGRNDPSPEPQRRMRPVVVALEHLDHRAELTAENVRIEKWPESIVPDGAATSLDDVLEKCVIMRVAKGLPILLKDVVDRNEVERLPIPPGFKVLAINVSADDHFGGLLAPGDRVDVIGVFGGRSGNEPVSRTFLRNIRVFSVNNNTRPDVERGTVTRTNNTIVGILLTEKQAEQLTLVKKMASIKLVLRGDDGDDDMFADFESSQGGFSLSDFLGHQQQPTASAASSGGLLNYLNQMSLNLATRQVSNRTGETKQTIVYTPEGPVVYTWGEDGLPQRSQGYPSSRSDSGNRSSGNSMPFAPPLPEPGDGFDDQEDLSGWFDQREDWE